MATGGKKRIHSALCGRWMAISLALARFIRLELDPDGTLPVWLEELEVER